ncbi:hypothetical protein GCM10010266_14410 [Streptomyces griseomycini]|nr:hypothetical protein GCM10010266_14410 [Streptomyces griseomycini]GGR33607.1 hypothetical protein GCM10015536_43960 [Streptomyces griseomycini]
MPVVLDQRLEVGQRLLERTGLDVPQHHGGQGSFVLRRQRHVGAGHGNGGWHSAAPRSPHAPSAHRALLRCTQVTSLRDYLSTVSTAL